MDTLLLTARLILALVFVVAGVMKLADLVASTKALREFGVPDSLARPVGILLPLIELAVAVALISTKYAWWGAVWALSVLLAFIGVIGINLSKGRAPNCPCFGQLGSGSVGLPTLIRNEMLAALAGLLIWQGLNNAGPSVLTWLRDLTTGERIRLVVGLVFLGLVAARKKTLELLRRRNSSVGGWAEAIQSRLPLAAGTAALATRLESTGIFPSAGLPVGTAAPNFDLVRPNSERVSLRTLFDVDKLVMLVFVDSDCGPCQLLLPEINYWASRHADSLTISVITRDDRQDGNAQSVDYHVANVLLQQESVVADAFGVAGFPTAVIVRPDGVISSRLALGAEAIRALLTDIAGMPATKSMPHFLVTDRGSLTNLPAAAQSGCRTCGP